MDNKYTTALYAAIISLMLVASMFAISYVQQAAAQGNQTGGGGNQTSAGGGNQTSAGGGNMTATGVLGGATTGGGGGSSGGG
jgi:hypothetical protein